MKQPGFGIRISQPMLDELGGKPTPMPFQDVEISGNRAGLLELADMIRKVAEATQEGYHIHLWPDAGDLRLRTKELGLTISLNSVK